MTAKSVLNSSVCVSTMLNNVPVVITGIHMGNVGQCKATVSHNHTSLSLSRPARVPVFFMGRGRPSPNHRIHIKTRLAHHI